MITLCIDTAMNACGVAVVRDGNVLAQFQEPMPRGQAEILVPTISNVIDCAGINKNDLTEIRVTCGPGTFTGIRIGLAAAKGLGLALNIPVIGVSTLDVLQAQLPRERNDALYMILIETKRQDFYTSIQDHTGKETIPAATLSGTDIITYLNDQSTIIGGDAVERFIADHGVGLNTTNANVEMINFQIIAQMTKTIPAEPLYLKDADVSTPKNIFGDNYINNT